MSETTYENKVSILAEIYLNYMEDEDFADFVKYNDLGLPLAYILDNDIAERSAKSDVFIDETFDLLLAGLGIVLENEDGSDAELPEFETLADVFGHSENGFEG